jgi:AsmA-like C-terminal region
MKLSLKILKWFAIGVSVILALLFCISIFLQDNLVNIFINSINKNISTKIKVGSGSFSLLNKFPRASVKLEDVFVHSSSGFDRSQFKRVNFDTLIYAKSVSLEFKMTDLIKGVYNIESASISDGIMNLYSDSTGMVNYEISNDSITSSEKELVINLERINVSNLSTIYINIATSLYINGLIKNGRFKSRIAGDNFDFTANSSLQLAQIDVFPLFLKTSTSATIDLNLHKSDSGIFFRKGVLKIENFNFGISGFISKTDNLDLKITGSNIDISKIKKFLPSKYLDKYMEYNPKGILRLDCGIKGLFNRRFNPDILIAFSIDNGHIFHEKSNIKLDKLSFTGNFHNGRLKRPETSTLLIKNIKASLGSATYSSSLSVRNLKFPEIDFTFSGEIIPAELAEFFNIKKISWSEGSLRLDLRLSGNLILKEKYSFDDFMGLNPEADIQFNSMGIGINNNKLVVNDIDGNIMIAKHLWAENLSFSYKGQRAKVDGEFTNLPAWLAGRPVYIKAVADLSVDNLIPSSFLPDSLTASVNQTAFQLPDGVELDINLNIDNLNYKKFSAGNIKGKLLYKPGQLNFKSFTLNSMDGYISGDYLLARGTGKFFISRGNFTLDRIDINKAFVSFNNFDQDFIIAENLAGSLSGTLSLLLPQDSLLNPRFNTITAEGKYIITDGTLINFEPVKSLSRFIELSELDNITFSKLENDFYIRNNYIAIPQMDIRSSAADLTISGKHDFDNNYEYHIKTYLSELLSKKAKKNKNTTTEFGAVEDDGLGRTSIFLKITGKGEDVKVGYDMKAARGNIKQNLKTEKENLKSIFNKEYGWFKKDSTIKQETAPRPKFRIQWEETDTIKTLTDTSTVKKERGISRIFKKKKGPELLLN